MNITIYRSHCSRRRRGLLSFKEDRHEDHRGIIALGRSDSADQGSAFARRFFTVTSSPGEPLRRADRRCTPFLYPNNLQSTAWHRTLLRNIVISPQLPGLFSTAYLRRPVGQPMHAGVPEPSRRSGYLATPREEVAGGGSDVR